MSEELLELPTNTKRSVRYPLFLNSIEMPHRLYPLIDVGVQILQFIAFILCFQLVALLTVPSGVQTGMFLIILLPFVGIFGRLFLRNARLTVSAQGISFPILMIRQLGGRLFRSWSDLEVVDLHAGQDKRNFIAGNVLTMVFKSGGRVDLDTTRIPRDDLRILQENLLLRVHPGVLTPATSELVSRNDLEISDSQMFVFAKKRRQLLSNSFGLTNCNVYKKGEAILGGDYIVEKILGAAGAQSLYLVTDTHAARNVCLKEYDLSMIDVDSRQKLSTELMIVGQWYKDLQIPDLLNLVDCKASDDKFYTMMEPAQRTLRDHINKHGVLSEKRVSALGLRLADVVAKLNEKDSALYVGGIRPDAVMYTNGGTVCVAEFGFADDLIMNSSQAIVVDSAYAAPERIAGHLSSVSDLYSIGAIMYFALTKQDPTPFAQSQASAINPKISSRLSNLIARLLSTDPSNRGNVAELIHDLGGVSITSVGAEQAGANQIGTEQIGTDRIGTEQVGTDPGGTEHGGANFV